MAESAATEGMETAAEAEAEKTLAIVMEPQATLCSKTEEGIVKNGSSDGELHSRVEKRKRFGIAGRVLVCYLKKMSPVKVLRRIRDCYVATLGGCAQDYASFSPYGVGLLSCHASPLPPTMRTFARNDDLHGSEFCLSPAFMKSFNESLLKGAFPDSDPGPSPFRKSFSDFESCGSPQMKRTYSDAATLYSRSPGNSRSGYCRRSPGWTPTRGLGGQAMMIFPIQEAPELILASFRKESQELHLASCRKEIAEPNLPLRKDSELPSLKANTITAVSNLPIQEVPEACYGSTPSPIAV